MKKRVGIPRALLYYTYYPLWREFFTSLGAEVMVSSPTTKGIVNQGVKKAVDEACLPVKLYYGHVIDLIGKVDYLFLPRMVSVEAKTYICPKFLGLPDMIRHNVDNLPTLIDVNINRHKNDKQLYGAVYQVGKIFSANPFNIYTAFNRALKVQNRYETLLQQGILPFEALSVLERGVGEGEETATPQQGMELNIALVGHPYNIYDNYISMNLIEKLKTMGAMVMTPEAVAPEVVEGEANKLPKKMFWNMGKKMVGSAYHFLNRPDVDGIIHLAAFGCGPDSFTGELVEREVRRKKTVPFLNLTIDEHTGEAGIVTRLEAFVDMIRWKAVSK
ncbi:MAG: acyl-CoA dehydratase activase-related protein [Thermincolia bacterium]